MRVSFCGGFTRESKKKISTVEKAQGISIWEYR